MTAPAGSAAGPGPPFIMLTGSINEETAVDCMKAGARDYVIKEHIRRLGPAFLSALNQKRLRMERKAAEQKFRESEELYRKGSRIMRFEADDRSADGSILTRTGPRRNLRLAERNVKADEDPADQHPAAGSGQSRDGKGSNPPAVLLRVPAPQGRRQRPTWRFTAAGSSWKGDSSFHRSRHHRQETGRGRPFRQ